MTRIPAPATTPASPPEFRQRCGIQLPGWLASRTIWLLIVAGFLLGAGLLLEFHYALHWPAEFVFAVSALLAGHEILRRAWRALLRLRLEMNFLMTIAAVGAFGIGHGEEGAAVLFLFAVAEGLEGYAEDRARTSIAKLLELAPPSARIRRNGEEVSVPTEEVQVREIAIVRPGEKIPLDGLVREGSSTVNQAAITGESIPVEKQPGDQVYAGTLVNEGYLEIEVAKRSTETVLSRIVALVKEAEQRKSRTERFVERFARYYTPTVVVLALLVATLPSLLLGQAFSTWFYRALVLLVVSCPCALAISTPVSIVAALTSAARQGVLVKGGEYIEAIRKARVFAFDKTGTLTEGLLKVDSIEPLDTTDRMEILKLAAGIEQKSQHPIARAIVESAAERDLEIPETNEFRSITGKGAEAVIGGTGYFLGSRRLFAEKGFRFLDGRIQQAEQRGATIVLLGSEDRILGYIAVSDRPRPTAQKAIQVLRSKGIRTVMLTGDTQGTAQAVARQLGIDEVHAELLPEHKVTVVEQLRQRYGDVVVVGDGVNDAPALARASVGIAMGAIGSDVALETADVALMQDDLSKIPYLVELSHKSVAVIKQNIAASISIKGGFGALAFPGLISLWLAVAVGDMGLSLAVILNALRLGWTRTNTGN
ncbi:MAG: heavy metal translocating P-type ATPase [Acidobacteriota bacterium]